MSNVPAFVFNTVSPPRLVNKKLANNYYNIIESFAPLSSVLKSRARLYSILFMLSSNTLKLCKELRLGLNFIHIYGCFLQIFNIPYCYDLLSTVHGCRNGFKNVTHFPAYSSPAHFRTILLSLIRISPSPTRVLRALQFSSKSKNHAKINK